MKSVTPDTMKHASSPTRQAAVVLALELTGKWVGHYTQHDSVRPISAEFAHKGPRLIGFMNDACTMIEGSVTDLMVEQQMPPGADERIVARIRSMCPGLERFPVRTLIEVPPLSTLDGQFERGRIEFVKTYRGEFFAGYQIGERRIGLRGVDQEVVYQGLLDAAGTQITGHWRVAGIRKAGSFSHRSTGSFVLRRVPENRLSSGPREPN
jgi:hypothetical protein